MQSGSLPQSEWEGEEEMIITNEMISLIEKALGFELYEWQKRYLMDEPHEVPNGRAVGRTTAYIIRLLLTNDKPIEVDSLKRYVDHGSSHYEYFFRSEVKYIHDKLTDVGIPTQLVVKRKPKQSIAIAVEADTNKLQLKLRAIAKHTEALADELDAIDNEGSEQFDSSPTIRQAFSQ